MFIRLTICGPTNNVKGYFGGGPQFMSETWICKEYNLGQNWSYFASFCATQIISHFSLIWWKNEHFHFLWKLHLAKVITTFLSSNAFIILTPFIALSQLIPVIKISFMGCIRKWTTNTQLGTSGDGRQDCNWSDSTVFLIFRTSNAFRDSFWSQFSSIIIDDW